MSQDSGPPRSSRTWWTPSRWWSTTPSTRLKMPQPASTSPKWKLQLGASLPCRHVASGALRYVERVIGHRYDDFAPLRTIRDSQVPVLLVHGDADTTRARLRRTTTSRCPPDTDQAGRRTQRRARRPRGTSKRCRPGGRLPQREHALSAPVTPGWSSRVSRRPRRTPRRCPRLRCRRPGSSRRAARRLGCRRRG